MADERYIIYLLNRENLLLQTLQSLHDTYLTQNALYC